MVLHGLSWDPRYLDRALGDYRTAQSRMPADAGPPRRATAAFFLAFALSLKDFPTEMQARKDRAGEILGLLDACAQQDASFCGLWIVDGLVREQMSDWNPAIDSLTKGLNGLEETTGLAPWEVYQFRLFGLLARSRALMDPATAQEHLAIKDVETAAALAEEALKDPLAPAQGNRLRPVVLTHRAAALEKLARLKEAQEILEVLIREDPGSFMNWFNLAIVFHRQHLYPQALRYYRTAADRAPADPRPPLRIAYILLTFPPPGGEPDIEGAEREAAKVLSLLGEEKDEYCALRGQAAFLRKDLKEAERWFRKSLARNPECRTSLNGMVLLLGQEEERTEKRQLELEDLRGRLSRITRARSTGQGMENEKPNLTFC